MKTIRSSFRRGFTLVELLVAMAITLSIVAVLAQVTSFSLDTFRNAREQVRQARLADVAIKQVSDDLESLVFRTGSNFNWLYIGEQPSSTGAGSNDSTNATWLLFAAAVPDAYSGGRQDKGGDISVLSYRLLYRDPIRQSASSDFALFSLYRQRIDPWDAFDRVIGFPLDANAGPNLSDAYRGAGFESDADSGENFLVENIFEMTVTLNVEVPRDPADPSQGFEIRPATYYTNRTNPNSYSEIRLHGDRIVTVPFDEDIAVGRAVSIEIGISVLTDEGSLLLQNNPNFPLEQLTNQHSRQYTTIVPIGAG